MRRVGTILRLIDELETELKENYTDKEIAEGIEKEGKKKKFHSGNCLVGTIYDEVSEAEEE